MEEVCGIAKGGKEDPLPLSSSPDSLKGFFRRESGAAAVSIARTMAAIIEPITRHPQKSTFRPPSL